jgi:hypothetical protein
MFFSLPETRPQHSGFSNVPNTNLSIFIFKTPEAGAVSAFSHVKGESEFLFPSRGKSGLYMVVPSPALPVVENAEILYGHGYAAGLRGP